jgi:hypothetical protein
MTSACTRNFQAFMTHNKPVSYEGTSKDGNAVKVVLSEWYNKSNFGSGEIYPYTIPSMYEKASHAGCFDFWGGVISFTEDNYTENTVLALRISADFESLSIIDKISHEALGTLERTHEIIRHQQ